MNVKGIIFLIGKTAIVKVFGEESWNSFISNLKAKDTFFGNTIWAITPVPMDKFIFFLDEMIKEFFNNDMTQYVTFGKVAAQFALSSEGPYAAYLLRKDMKLFVESVLTKLWSTYFDKGIVTTKFENNVVHLKITKLQIKNYYFEKLLMGYFQKALKIFGKNTVVKQVRSISSGNDNIYFTFALKDS
ncbi:MAG TPA: hypothetical protein VMU29_13830 [Smithella sp.]|nr:hypothetical protein [Smithella sp.]